MTLKNFLEQSVVSKLDCIENKLIQMMNEDNRQERVNIKFDIQSEIESILTDLGLKEMGCGE